MVANLTVDPRRIPEMSLDTQTFGMSRYWLSVALERLHGQPDLFKSQSLSTARKAFLAGKNQVAAIKNWLVCAEIIELRQRQALLTDLGKLMAAQDARAEEAWTWWLFHLHLCANDDAFPYDMFFRILDPDGKTWRSFEDIVEELFKSQQEDAKVAEKSVRTYFEGIDKSLRPTWPIYGLGLIDRRRVPGEVGKERVRRRRTLPHDLVVLYAALLFQKRFAPNHPTVNAPRLLERGLAKVLGMWNSDIRDAFIRINQDPDLGEFLHYTQAANLDSLQFVRSGVPALKKVRAHAYQSNGIRWP